MSASDLIRKRSPGGPSHDLTERACRKPTSSTGAARSACRSPVTHCATASSAA
jgi:hypothetical protein